MFININIRLASQAYRCGIKGKSRIDNNSNIIKKQSRHQSLLESLELGSSDEL